MGEAQHSPKGETRYSPSRRYSLRSYASLRLLRPRSVKNIVDSRPNGCDSPYFFPCRTRFISRRERSRSKHSALRVNRLLFVRKYHNSKAYAQAKIKGEHLLPFDFWSRCNIRQRAKQDIRLREDTRFARMRTCDFYVLVRSKI